jgi:hypothetical protein
MKFETIVGAVVLAVVAGGVAIGFATIGPPQHMRLVSLDRRRVDDLRSIAYDFRNGESGGVKRLPPRLSSSDDPNSGLRDPVTRVPYEYRRESATRYRLCATFDLPADSAYGEGGWRHGAGRQCFELDVNGPAEPLAAPSPMGKR